MKKAVFFDWDGTLVDSLTLLITAHNHVRAAYGLPLWSKEEFFGAVTYSSRELYPKIYGENSDAAQAMLFSYIKEHHLDHVSIMDGAKDLIEDLKARGIPMAVISNKRNDILVREVEHFGWQDYFGVYMGAGIAAKDKPSGEPLRYALSKHPVSLTMADLIYVGDTETDLRTCQDAGVTCAYIRQEGRSEGLIDVYQPAIVVDNLQELREKLAGFLMA